ncbi:MAG: cell division protein ZapA [Bacteroidia bacterium]
MEELSIKVNIANRSYPLTVQADEEEMVRRAAKLINDKLKDLQQLFAVKDMQDMLSMISLEIAYELIRLKNTHSREQELLQKEVQQLQQMLEPVNL